MVISIKMQQCKASKSFLLTLSFPLISSLPQNWLVFNKFLRKKLSQGDITNCNRYSVAFLNRPDAIPKCKTFALILMPNGLSSFKLKTHITLDKLVIYVWVGMGANYRVLFGIDHQLTLDITFPLNHHSDDIMDAVASTGKDELQLKRRS